MAVDFNAAYTSAFSSILSQSIDEGTPYKATIDFLTEKFDEYDISDEYKAQLQAQLMSNMTVGFTQSAMNMALQLANKNIMIDDEIDAKKKQNLILDKQALKLEADTALVSAQEDAITQQVIDNRKIKTIESLGETYSNMAMGSMVVSEPMWTTYYDLISDLLNISGLSIPAAEAIEVTKVT